MTGNEMRTVRRAAGLTQSALAEHVGLSRKSINEAEALGDGFVERRTELAVRALTLTAAARSELIEDAIRARAGGNTNEADLLEYAASLCTGNFATDERTIYNLARTAATYRRETIRMNDADYRRRSRAQNA